MKDLYKDKLSPFSDMSDMSFMDPRCLAMIAVWALIVKGIVIFVLPRTHGSHLCALVKGAMYGLIIYGSYQLTNFAVLANWPTQLVCYDIAWGMALCAVITCFSMCMAKWCGYENMCGCECSMNGKGKKACQ
jgi:uncharacterized membrane protein